VPSHPCAKDAQGWRTLSVFGGQEVKDKIKINVKGAGQECPTHTSYFATGLLFGAGFWGNQARYAVVDG
jgi:hypothetical protein